MVNNKKKTFWIVFSGFALIGAYFVYNKYFKKGANYEAVQKNLNAKGTEQGVAVLFNGGKYKGSFWVNDRMTINDAKTKALIVKGTYSNGGKTIILDTAYGGKKAEGESVYGNLLQLIP